MVIQVDFWYLLGLLLSFISTLATFGLILIKQIDSRINHYHDQVNRFESTLNKMLTRLPIEYQRREDSFRSEDLLNAKLDKISARIERLMSKPT